MKKRSFIALLLCILLMTGCGAAKEEAAMTAAAPAAIAEEAGSGYYLYDNEMPTEEAIEEPAEAEKASEIKDPLADRKLITTMDVSAETEDMDILLYNIETWVSELGGYMEQTQIWNGSAYDVYSSRSAYMTIRVPAEHLSAFVNRMAEQSNIVNQSKSVEDVTLSYVDLESRKKALLVEQERLLELLEMAESMEDILAIEDKLGEVRYELESMESQLRTYDNKINYSTIHLDITEVERLTPVQEETTWDKISNGLGESFYNVCNGIKNFFVGLIISIPYLVLIAVIIVIVIWVVTRIQKKNAKKRAKELEKLKSINDNMLEDKEK
ncbi:MAG: DUF4349 domain-containing protein [Lachnospiraceae bacterium]|nr:DUF4349 domain-containing protein [Lachnospiraceae bacterium]